MEPTRVTWDDIWDSAKKGVESVFFDDSMSGDEKREYVSHLLYNEVIERVDDLVLLLPGGWGIAAKVLVDNKISDAIERQISGMIVEGAYQAVREVMSRLSID